MSCLRVWSLWWVDVIVFVGILYLDLVGLWLMCCNVWWILSWLGARKLALSVLYKG